MKDHQEDVSGWQKKVSFRGRRGTKIHFSLTRFVTDSRSWIKHHVSRLSSLFLTLRHPYQLLLILMLHNSEAEHDFIGGDERKPKLLSK